MTPEKKLRQLGIDLPAPAEPVGAYVAALPVGGLIFTAGQIPTKDGKLVAAGKVPTEVPLEKAHDAARQAVLNALAAIRCQLGSLDAVKRIVR
ncbi:MAG: RidA family protein, partial [Planctomycetota bacterium]